MRITGGVFRSRVLVAPPGSATRPTSDRVREALFSILTARRALAGARVLDLYAGTGALAIEALSRGAARATLVESKRAALAAIRANIEALGIGERVLVVPSTVERAALRVAENGPFDVVFADPPYADVDSAASVLASLAAAKAFGKGATVILEHAAGRTPSVAGLPPPDARRYGDTTLSFFLCERECDQE
jgi:16S rRNA (guanine966-N2)-methyltransferase